MAARAPSSPSSGRPPRSRSTFRSKSSFRSAKLAAEDFVDDEDANPPKIVAFDAFRRFLDKGGLTGVDRGIDLETPLWRFWHNGRPMRASDYRKGDYYDCSKCNGFVSLSRGKLVPRKLAGFGTHYAFVCKKH